VTSTLSRWLSMALFLILVYCSFLSATYLTSTPEEISTGAGALAPIITGLIAVGSIALAYKTSKSDVRRSWQMLLIGISMWVLADIIWGAQEIWGLQQEAYFSFADLLWIAGYIPIGAAMWFYLPPIRTLLRDLRTLIILVAICFLPLVVFGLQLGSIFNSPVIQENGLIALIPAVYPILDAFLAVGGLLIALNSHGQASRWPWLLIGSAFVLWAYSDLWNVIVVLNDWYYESAAARLSVDLTYTLAYLILAVGAILSIQSDALVFAEE
jgi:hypothetical protein